jgi:hypothetical protein
MNINPFKRIADLEARIAQVEKQAAAAMATASTSMDVMTKLPSIAVMEQALEAVKILDMQVDNLMSENKARRVGAEHLSKLVSVLQEDLLLLKASRNMVTPEEVSRRSIDAQIERDRAKQREYNAAYRARQKAKAEAEIRKAKRMEYQRAYRARRKAQKAAQEAAK